MSQCIQNLKECEKRSALPQALLRKDINTHTDTHSLPASTTGNFLQLIQCTFPALPIIFAAVTYTSCTLFFSTFMKQNTNLKICLQWWIEISWLLKQMTVAEELVLHIQQQTPRTTSTSLFPSLLCQTLPCSLVPSLWLTITPCAAPTQATSPPEDLEPTGSYLKQFLFLL